MKENELAYTAGIVDGEGCIRLRPNGCWEIKTGDDKGQINRYWTVDLAVGNTVEMICRWLQYHFGGAVHPRPAKGRRKAYWLWRLYGYNAVAFLEQILPYLIIKKPQAELAIVAGKRKSQRRGENWRISEGEKVIQEAEAILMHSLNKKGEG